MAILDSMKYLSQIIINTWITDCQIWYSASDDSYGDGTWTVRTQTPTGGSPQAYIGIQIRPVTADNTERAGMTAGVTHWGHCPDEIVIEAGDRITEGQSGGDADAIGTYEVLDVVPYPDHTEIGMRNTGQ